MITTRRTQAERRAATQAAILDATITSLAEMGHARTTTAEIAARAGVSQGSIFRYWESKDAVLIAAANRVIESAFVEYGTILEAELLALEGTSGRVRRSVELVYELFQQPDVLGVLSLCAAARSEEVLVAALPDVAIALRAAARGFAATVVPGSESHPNFEHTVDIVTLAIQGSAVGVSSHDPDVRERTISSVTATVESMLAVTPAPQ